jgi:hypothetical protein
MSGLCRVNWYTAREERPPIRMAGGLLRNTWIPGICANFGISERITPSASSVRSDRGVRRTERRPELPPPTEAMKSATLGSFLRISFTCSWCSTTCW